MEELEQLIAAIKSMTDFDDDLITEDFMREITDNLNSVFPPYVINQAVNQILQNFEDQNITKADAVKSTESLCELIKDKVYGEQQLTGHKKELIDLVLDKLFSIFNEAVDRYHSYSIVLPMTVDTAGGAQVPTYAHDTDAAADLYAMEDIEIPAHSYGNKIRTGVKIQLPEGWLAFILPRSSIGAKTPLRLSNSVGLIDSGYRGELGVLYDNTSDDGYFITKGDRIAQLLVMPSYRFQAKVVDILADSDRGEGGFGASGK